MRRFAERWSARGVSVVGLIETAAPDTGSSRWATRLESWRDSATYPLFQDLGPHSTSCHLDGAGIVAACMDLCEQVKRGCDLVVLSKFGQLEAQRSGLIDAFTLAAERDLPILTAVAPAYRQAWDVFSAPLCISLPPDDRALDRWWEARPGRCPDAHLA